MKKNILTLFFLANCLLPIANCFSQNLPHQMTDAEKQLLPQYNLERNNSPLNALSILPPSSPVRTIAEWEELQGLLITWISYTPMLKEIVRAAKQECRVYIVCSNTQTVINYLATAPAVDTVNVTFINASFNSVWSRDFGPWNAYTNDVDTLVTIDWIYNRPRPLDDAIPPVIATALGTPLYQTTTSPWDLVNTGGNFMTDGFGTAFASKLILTDNLTSGGFGVNHTEAEIDTIIKHFMGITRYIKMTTLPYDQIHHIDMHIKLLDEETLLVGQYPAGVADGPQIEANLQYILSNFNSVYGTPYKVTRITMPADAGQYPPTAGADYFTYTNSSFINKTIIVPTYNISSDTTALRIYREALPGYKVVGINSTASIGALGALHCITKELGTSDPLLISHQPLSDTYDYTNPYHVDALMKHRTGIANATLYYRTDTLLPYQSVAMSVASANHWAANIPAQPVGSTIYYYVHAQAVSGKQQVRPLPAPAGYWHFRVLGTVGIDENISSTSVLMLNAFPNPSKGITCIPVQSNKEQQARLTLTDIAGRTVLNVFDGKLKHGDNKLFLDSWNLAAGYYLLTLKTEDAVVTQGLVVR